MKGKLLTWKEDDDDVMYELKLDEFDTKLLNDWLEHAVEMTEDFIEEMEGLPVGDPDRTDVGRAKREIESLKTILSMLNK